MSENNSKDPNLGSFVTGFTLTERANFPPLSSAAYMKLVEPLAKEVEDNTGILYRVPLIQSCHESAAGNSGLAKEYGNLFGFKATDRWKKDGKPVANLPTWEVVETSQPENFKDFNPIELKKYIHPVSGKEMHQLKITLKQEFRIYATWRDSLFDWGRLISTVKVYADAYKLLQRRETVRDGIRTMGKVYATDNHYAEKLIALYDKVDPGIK